MGENRSKSYENNKKRLEIVRFQVLNVVEISGIEPLTS